MLMVVTGTEAGLDCHPAADGCWDDEYDTPRRVAGVSEKVVSDQTGYIVSLTSSAGSHQGVDHDEQREPKQPSGEPTG